MNMICKCASLFPERRGRLSVVFCLLIEFFGTLLENEFVVLKVFIFLIKQFKTNLSSEMSTRGQKRTAINKRTSKTQVESVSPILGEA